MATEAATAKDAEFILVSLLPDVCLTPNRKGKPVPYPITHDMGESKQCSPNVFFRGKAAYLHEESYVDNVKGDEPGGGKGVVSRTHVKISRSEQYSHNVFVNGRHLVRTGDKVWMNRAEPGDASGSAAASGKKARWECRQGQIAAARDKLSELPDGTDKDRLQAAADRFERNNVAVEHAKLSDVIYDPNKRAEGWNDVSDQAEKLEQYGLKPGDLEIEGSNFRARVYEPDPAVFGNDMKPTAVFKGTEIGEDWVNNFAQGLASIQITINVQSRSEHKLKCLDLSSILPAIRWVVVGTPHVLEGTGLNPIDRHGMEQVIAGIEAQKSEDQQTIASATGKTCK